MNHDSKFGSIKIEGVQQLNTSTYSVSYESPETLETLWSKTKPYIFSKFELSYSSSVRYSILTNYITIIMIITVDFGKRIKSALSNATILDRKTFHLQNMLLKERSSYLSKMA